jgi:hypothetical protein
MGCLEVSPWLKTSSSRRAALCRRLCARTAISGRAGRVVVAAFSGFAALTGDAHPIHYDEGYAAQTRFKRPIAHGLLLMALTAPRRDHYVTTSRRVDDCTRRAGCEISSARLRGDRVRAQFTVEAVDMKPGKGAAIVRLSVRLLNEAQERLPRRSSPT